MPNSTVLRHLTLGVVIIVSLGFESLDRCSMCHQAAPVSAAHPPTKGIAWPECATCHGFDPSAAQSNVVIRALHEKHVGELGFNCSICHASSNRDDEAAGRERLSRMLGAAAAD